MADETHDPTVIPAASIGACNLKEVAKANPAAATEIAHLSDLMDVGEESAEQFLKLCQLLVDVGYWQDSEHLLRRNIEGYDGGRQLYEQLFGTEKLDEYNAAVESFKSQFEVELEQPEQSDFLVTKFRCFGGPYREDDYALLSKSTEIEIGFVEREIVEADLCLYAPEKFVLSKEECLFMLFINGVWEIADPLA